MDITDAGTSHDSISFGTLNKDLLFLLQSSSKMILDGS